MNYVATRAIPKAGGSADIDGLVQRHRPGGPLERAFYTAPEVFEADLRQIFYRRWLFAGHACSIPRAGDYFTWRVGSESIIVVRGKDGEIRGFHNFCRHRGTAHLRRRARARERSSSAPTTAGPTTSTAALITATQREFDVDRETLGLLPVHLHNARRPDLRQFSPTTRRTSRTRSRPSSAADGAARARDAQGRACQPTTS